MLPITQWYEPHRIDHFDCLISLVERRASIAHQNIAEQFYLQASGKIEWNCYVCSSKILVNVKNFSGKEVFCAEHKPSLFTNRYKKDLILLRYVNSLFRIIQSRITKNS